MLKIEAKDRKDNSIIVLTITILKLTSQRLLSQNGCSVF